MGLPDLTGENTEHPVTLDFEINMLQLDTFNLGLPQDETFIYRKSGLTLGIF